MAKELASDSDSGIYREIRYNYTGVDMVEHLKGFMDFHRTRTFEGLLTAIEDEARRILAEHGYPDWPIAEYTITDGERRLKRLGVPNDAAPIARDAGATLHCVQSIRHQLAHGETDLARWDIFSLGRFIERLHVRTQEHHAASSKKSRKASSASRQDLALRRATFWRDLYLNHKQDHPKASEAERWRWVSAQAYKLSWSDTEAIPAEYGHNSNSNHFNPDYIRKAVKKTFGAL